MAYRAPVIENILRQHAEEAAHLWNVYDYNLLHPGENEEMDEERMSRLVERLDAHIDALRIAGGDGRRLAEARYSEFPEAGEFFVVWMLQRRAERLLVAELEVEKVREYFAVHRVL